MPRPAPRAASRLVLSNVLVAVLAPALPVGSQGEACRFVLGFAALREQVGAEAELQAWPSLGGSAVQPARHGPPVREAAPRPPVRADRGRGGRRVSPTPEGRRD